MRAKPLDLFYRTEKSGVDYGPLFPVSPFGLVHKHETMEMGAQWGLEALHMPRYRGLGSHQTVAVDNKPIFPIDDFIGDNLRQVSQDSF